MKIKIKKRLGLFKPFAYVALVVVLGIFVMSIFSKTKFVDLFTFGLAFLLYAILPGYCVLINTKIEDWELAVFSIPLSIVIVTSLVYLLNVLLGIPMSIATVLIVIIISSVVGFFWTEIKSKLVRKQKQ